MTIYPEDPFPLQEYIDEVSRCFAAIGADFEVVLSSLSSKFQEIDFSSILNEPLSFREKKAINSWILKWLLDHFGTYSIMEDKQVGAIQVTNISKPLCRSPPVEVIRYNLIYELIIALYKRLLREKPLRPTDSSGHRNRKYILWSKNYEKDVKKFTIYRGIQ